MVREVAVCLKCVFSSARTYDNLDACVVVRSPDLVTAASLLEVCMIVSIFVLVLYPCILVHIGEMFVHHCDSCVFLCSVGGA